MNKKFFFFGVMCVLFFFGSSLPMELVTETEYDVFLDELINNIQTFLEVKRMFKREKQIDQKLKLYKKNDHVYISSSEDIVLQQVRQSEE